MNYYNTIELTGNYSIEFSILMGDANTGFHLATVNGNSPPTSTGIYFYAYSGYIFDKSGNMAGGYVTGSSINLKCNIFENRYSYYINDLPCNNNIQATNPTNYLEYNKASNTKILTRIGYHSGAF